MSARIRSFSGVPLCRRILAIETSCDDTCAAVVDGAGRLLSNITNVQTPIHNRFGGINPPLAAKLHQDCIGDVVNGSLSEAGCSMADVDYVAVTTRPGLVSCLRVGVEYALSLARTHCTGLIRVHHMRAHALTAMYARHSENTSQPKYPLVYLLASGGHCLLGKAASASEFVIFGSSLDSAPGDLLDKISRRLRLQHLPPVQDEQGHFVDLAKVSGGRAIELLAYKGDPLAFLSDYNFLTKQSNCNFSFSGLRSGVESLVSKLEEEQNKVATHIQGVEDLCASLLHTIFRQIVRRVQRAIEICDNMEWMPPIDSQHKRQLVLSGGVACNGYLRKGLECIISDYNYELIYPPAVYCTDNAAMIAWNALLMLQDAHSSSDIFCPQQLPSNVDEMDIKFRAPIGEDISQTIAQMKWRVQKRRALNKLNILL